MKNESNLVLAVVIACVTGNAFAEPAVLTVAKDGQADYRSIQEAIVTAPANAVLRIAPGVYEEHLTISKPITLEGAGWDKTTIMTKAGVAEVFEQATQEYGRRVRQAESDEQRKATRTEFEAKLRGGDFGESTVLVTNTDAVVIRDLKISSPGRSIERRLLPGSVVRFDNSQARLSGCVVIEGPGDGISIAGGSDVEIRNCLVAAVWSTGIVIAADEGLGPKTRILDTDVRNCHYAGIRIGPGCDSTVVKRCRISGAAWHGIRYDDASPTIDNSLIFANARCGIYASGETKALVSDNVFYKNEMDGISCWADNKDSVLANTFASNLRAALRIINNSQPAIARNIFYDHPEAIAFNPTTGPTAADGLGKNIYWNNRQAVAGKDKDLQDGVDVDPGFVNAVENNFSLALDSPARKMNFGIADPIAFDSPWPLQPQELAIIPDGDTRDSKQWKRPDMDAPAAHTPAKEQRQTAARIAEDRRHIEELIDQLHRTRAILIEAERLSSLPDAEEKLAAYRRTLEQVANQPGEDLPPDAAKKRAQELKEAKQLHGDNWDRVYGQVKSAVGLPVAIELCDTEMEPFIRIMLMYSGNYTVIPLETRKDIEKALRINPYTNPDEFWQAYKDYLRGYAEARGQGRDQLAAKFKISAGVVEQARNEAARNWQKLGYQSLIDMFSQEKVQQTQKYLKRIEQKLAEYPDWKVYESGRAASELRPQPTPAKKDHWRAFDGRHDYVLVADSPSLDVAEALTVEAWINFEQGGTYNPRIVSKGWEVRTGYELAVYGTGIERKLAFLAKNLGRTFSNELLFANRWYHVAATYDGSAVRLYINGQENTVRAVSGSIATNDVDLNIGRNSQNSTDRYKGKIAQVRIWNTARSANEIRRDMERQLTGSEAGLVACWRFGRESGEILPDISANKNNGRIVGSGTAVRTAATYEQAFVDLYRELGENYPCFGLKEIDWKAVGEEFFLWADEVENDEEFGLLCVELIARLQDSHAYLLEGSAEVPKIQLPQWDPGFACLEDDQGRPVVYYIRKDSPAEQAQIKAGMIVLALNGEDAYKVIEKTMKRRSKYIGYSSERYLRYHAYRFFVRQSDQRTVKIRMLDTAGGVLDLDLPCTVKAGYLPRLPVPGEGIADSGSVSWKMLGDQIGYIYVRRIRKDLIPSLDKAVAELNKARGLIIDVRGNSGGGYDARRSHLNFALDRDSEEPDRPRFKGAMALLIDSRCISAGEGWASWFIANKRAHVFGEATAGASSRKKTYTLKNGLYRVKYPIKAYKGALDRPIERLGLEPDVPVKPTSGDIAAAKDTVLQTAKEYLLKKP